MDEMGTTIEHLRREVSTTKINVQESAANCRTPVDKFYGVAYSDGDDSPNVIHFMPTTGGYYGRRQ